MTKEEIKKRISFECKIIAENKADSKYEIVGVASIFAKELREMQDLAISGKETCLLEPWAIGKASWEALGQPLALGAPWMPKVDPGSKRASLGTFGIVRNKYIGFISIIAPVGPAGDPRGRVLWSPVRPLAKKQTPRARR